MMCKLFRIVAHEGGTRSGKTWNIIEYLIDEANEHPFIEITIASRNMPHLKKGAIKDFQKIMIKRRIWNDNRWHDSDKKYTFPNGAYIEFFNADDLGNASGPGRDILYCNEVNFFKEPVFSQLLLRTRRSCIIDYNPIHPRHWLYSKVVNRKDCYLWRSTYKDNLEFLPKEQVREIEMMQETDPLRWQVYGLGKRASIQKGQIYGQAPFKPWKEITDREYAAIEERELFGLDWGFFPDPNAVLGVKAKDNKRWIKKYIYETNQTDEDLVKKLQAAGLDRSSIIIADHNNKSITNVRKLGFPMTYAAIKPKIEQGIKLIRPLETHYVMDPDLDFEYYNYTYLLDPSEQITGVPQDKYNHLMDDYRYVEHYRGHL
jgi:phage terminase large subunit